MAFMEKEVLAIGNRPSSLNDNRMDDIRHRAVGESVLA
jgi:hypothetical protein